MDILTIQPALSAFEASSGTPSRTRAACNRCHAQKLKCVKKVEQGGSCERCTRLRTTCRYGPRAARVSARPLERAADHESVHDDLLSRPATPAAIPSLAAFEHDMEWFPNDTPFPALQTDSSHSVPCFADTQEMCWNRFFGVDRTLNRPLDYNVSSNVGPFAFHDRDDSMKGFPVFWTSQLPHLALEDHNSVNGIELDQPSIVQRLASLDVEIYECGLMLPIHVKTGSGPVGIGTRKAKLFALDVLFRLTADFVNIANYETRDNDRPTIYHKTVDVRSRLDQIDEATTFAIMSCHSRLTEIYASLFYMMHACIEHSLAPRRDKDWAVLLPQLQVGSEVGALPVLVNIDHPASPSTSSMYMWLITMLSSQLWEQLADTLRFANSGGSRSEGSVLTDTVWNTIAERSDSMLETIERTKQTLQRPSAA